MDQISYRESPIGVPLGDRIRNATLATDSPVPVSRGRGDVVLEVLLPSGMQVVGDVPLLLDHNRGILTSVGSVKGIQAGANSIDGQLSFASRTQAAEEAWELVNQNHIRTVSAGYRVLEEKEILPGRTAVVEGRTFTAPANRSLVVVIRWRLLEVSLVTIPADVNARIRSALHFQGGSNMAIGRDQARFDEFFRQRFPKQHEFQTPDQVIRSALASLPGFEAFEGLVNTMIIDGFRNAEDTTAGWVRTVNLPNALESTLGTVEKPMRLQQLGRGGTAQVVSIQASKPTKWRLVRFAGCFTVDEQDVIDNPLLSTMQVVMNEVGAAARRLIPDLVYATLLQNPQLADKVACFDAARANLATAALDQTSLDAGLAAIGNQVLHDVQPGAVPDGTVDTLGDPIHINLSPRYLMVPPAKVGAARRLARDMAAGDGRDLVVRAESRLSSTDLVDPLSDGLINGNNKNWLLACPEQQAPGVALGLLNGKAEPTIRTAPLKGGEWGFCTDVQFYVAVALVDGRPLYWSQGE